MKIIGRRRRGNGHGQRIDRPEEAGAGDFLIGQYTGDNPAAMEKKTTISEYLTVTNRLLRKASEVSRLVKSEKPTNLLISPLGVVGREA